MKSFGKVFEKKMSLGKEFVKGKNAKGPWLHHSALEEAVFQEVFMRTVDLFYFGSEGGEEGYVS
jgi:hypothetical protein